MTSTPTIVAVFLTLALSLAAVAAPPRDDSAAEKLGFTLGTQAWTWRERTAFEAIEMAQALGLKRIELYPGQKLSKETGEVKVGPELTAEQRAMLKKKLSDCAVTPNSFGVVGIPNDEAKARVNFEFVKDMGMQTVTCEPEKDAWDLTSKLADEYKLNVAIHNHPKPSFYWNPATVLEAIKGRSPRMGACADTGHWPRSGLSPVDQLKALSGHIVELHFKDIIVDDAHKGGEDRPWGTGQGNAKGMLEELRRQGFKGVILLEYEVTSGKELEENAQKCVKWFDEACAQILAAEAHAPPAGKNAQPAGKK